MKCLACASRLLRFIALVLAFCIPAATILAAPGGRDPQFGDNGRVATDFFGRVDAAVGAALQTDGKIVVVGHSAHTDDDVSLDFSLARYNADGTLDSDFGEGGLVSTDFFGEIDEAESVAIQPDGRIVVAGFVQRSQGAFDFGLARYTPDGTLDREFGVGGKVATDFADDDDFATEIALLADGRIVAAGGSYNAATEEEDFAIAVYHSNGTLDAGFGAGGQMTTDFLGHDDEIKGIVVQPDGRVVAAGYSYTASDDNLIAMVRYNTDGGLNTDFGTGGKVTSDRDGFLAKGSDVVLQPDGRLVVCGRAAGTRNDFFLTRYTSNGSLDTTFGGSGTGTVTTDFNGGDDDAVSLALQVNGKIVAIGKSYKTQATSSRDWVVARYNANGVLDAGFGIGGRVIEDFAGDYDAANVGVLQPDGNLLVVGEVTRPGTGLDFGIVRYEGDPVPDFNLAITPDTINVTKRQKGQIVVSIGRVRGFAGSVTVTAPNTKPIKVKLTPPTITASGDTATFNFKIKKKAAVGSYPIVFSGKDATGRERTATLTLVVS